MVKDAVDKAGLNVKINNISNPRKEQEEHYYNSAHSGLIELGLRPHYLTENVIS